ncbi:hypothetical protein BCR34DRAFT_660311 [Clohesyomyces aquaticus]|uniref:Uncharacterized protein n=1 Tax=Clohesyomyces aquaticus TaxID=1231657 RepID=A0A1Y2A749_9PLEO|nr:hypothetical protein BCR34DRAFT_660311 [Clohesyomyces aquaticus]
MILRSWSSFVIVLVKRDRDVVVLTCGVGAARSSTVPRYKSHTPLTAHQHITPSSSLADPPLTPPPTDEKPFCASPHPRRRPAATTLRLHLSSSDYGGDDNAVPSTQPSSMCPSSPTNPASSKRKREHAPAKTIPTSRPFCRPERQRITSDSYQQQGNKTAHRDTSGDSRTCIRQQVRLLGRSSLAGSPSAADRASGDVSGWCWPTVLLPYSALMCPWFCEEGMRRGSAVRARYIP